MGKENDPQHCNIYNMKLIVDCLNSWKIRFVVSTILGIYVGLSNIRPIVYGPIVLLIGVLTFATTLVWFSIAISSKKDIDFVNDAINRCQMFFLSSLAAFMTHFSVASNYSKFYSFMILFSGCCYLGVITAKLLVSKRLNKEIMYYN